MAFSPGVINAMAAANFHKGLVQPLLVDAELLDHLGRCALGLHDGGYEQVLHAHVFVFEPVRFPFGVAYHGNGPWGGVNLTIGYGYLGSGVQQLMQTSFHGVGIYSQLAQNVGRQAVL